MEDPPRKHDKKNNNKTLPVTVNIGAGAGSFGVASIVLLGGALVTATIVSALAFKRRRQHRSSSENSNKSMSPAPETKTGDGSNHLELMMKSNKDFSVDPDLHNPSDGLTSMKELQAKDIQNVIADEKHDYGMDDDEQLDSGDGNEGVIYSVVGEDQKSTSSYVDSVFESGELDCEEEMIMEAWNEEDSSEVLERGVGGEEKKYLMPIDDENDEQVEAKSLVSDEVVTPIEEYEAIEGVEVEESLAKDITVEAAQDEARIGDDVAQASEEKDEESEDQETAFMNGEEACVNQVIVEDKPQVQFIEEQKEDGYGDDEVILENFKGDLINETGNAYEIVSELVMDEEDEEEEEDEAIDAGCVHHVNVQNGPQVQFVEDEKEQDQQMQFNSEQVMGEKTIKAACVDLVNVEENMKIADHEEMRLNEVNGTFSSEEHPSCAVACTMNDAKVADDDQTTVKDNPTQLMNKEEGIQTAQKVEEQATIEDGSVNFDEKDKVGEMPHVQLIEAVKVDDQTKKREDNPPTNLTNKEENVKETIETITEDELVKKDEIPHVQSVEEDENEEDVTVRTEVVSDELEDSSVKSMQEEPAPHVQSVEEGENNEEDVTVKNEVVPDELEDSSVKSIQEKPAPNAKISNQKIEENMEENGTILGKGQNDSDLNNNSIKEDKDSKSASMSIIELAKGIKQALASEPWNRKLLTCSVLVSIWCLCHWYTQLPFPKLTVVGSLLFILILLGYQNRTTYLVKYA